ncbi:variant leucine-rich repeat-containing protein [Alloscardovia macacae]|uniref:Leucine rich repeat variant domain-containing protein n=1 Tax=Alloscardovia macacae TaxID=1160091 RepID=A0A261F6P5_9BIFI|nr:hypothetical protein [Alloscardovia macacae]OZG54829.1 hypothetical protein ALMA_0154 [Alloscardovia macacae]
MTASRLPRFYPGSPPPRPPLILTPRVATDPATSEKVLWFIARHIPELRFWLVANESASPALLEYISQAGGPRVKEAFHVLFSALEG